MPDQPAPDDRPPAPKQQLRRFREEMDGARLDADAIRDTRAVIESLAAHAATRSSHIDDGAKYVDRVRAELETANSTVTDLISKVTSIVGEGEASRDAAAEFADEAKDLLSELKGHSVSCKDILAVMAVNEEKSQKLAQVAEQVESRVAAYEQQLALLEIRSVELQERIQSLLPGATTVGLASAFENRRRYVHRSLMVWQGASVLTILVLFALALFDFEKITDLDLTLPHLGLVILRRLPFVGPLLWLILYCQRQAATSKRIEEEYAFKASISQSFEGYKAQMAGLDSDHPDGSPLKKLCSDTLVILATPPGRIYEKHRSDVTPLTALTDSAPKLASAFKVMGEAANSWRVSALPAQREKE